MVAVAVRGAADEDAGEDEGAVEADGADGVIEDAVVGPLGQVSSLVLEKPKSTSVPKNWVTPMYRSAARSSWVRMRPRASLKSADMRFWPPSPRVRVSMATRAPRPRDSKVRRPPSSSSGWATMSMREARVRSLRRSCWRAGAPWLMGGCRRGTGVGAFAGEVGGVVELLSLGGGGGQE